MTGFFKTRVVILKLLHNDNVRVGVPCMLSRQVFDVSMKNKERTVRNVETNVVASANGSVLLNAVKNQETFLNHSNDLQVFRFLSVTAKHF